MFDVMSSIGNVDEDEMFRAFNMGIGMIFVVDPNDVSIIKNALKELTDVFELGSVVTGERHVSIH